jgi:lipid-A-disaccharide synthase
LGRLPSIFFALRFFLQWIHSEKKKKSLVDPVFWRLSLCGNFLLAIHYFIQLQFVFYLIQISNGYISIRNLNIIKKRRKITFKISAGLLCTVLVTASLLFFTQSFLFTSSIPLFQIPAGFSSNSREVSWLWHLFGSLGCLLFASRFWIQWIEAEKCQESQLKKNFWLISILGSLAALLYFLHIKDWVSTLNYSFGLIPYVRNLLLVNREAHKAR